ncbi:type I-C CRISPR-associated protein Cas8c/Csd1, partial [bacterium]|nr:type I-C CRISPR-associated protein Cas8c/Csd1 [bacterium]
GETQKLKDVLSDVAKGRTLQEIDPRLDPDTRFYVLGLAPNIARLSVRFWREDSFGNLVGHFRQHWADTRIDPWPWKTHHPAVKALLVETAMLRKFENIPANLTGETMRAILTGGRYPRSLLAAVIIRMRADHDITGRRAAICRACLIRDLRLKNELPADKKEDYLVSLDRNETNSGYRLGRLFAVLENAQRAALGKINATIRDRYYGAASATPASVFPLLLRTGAHHIASLRKENKGGWIDREIEEILNGLAGTVFPKSLSIEDQGRFAIGYYHQRAYRKPADDAAAEIDDTVETDDSEA